MTDLPSYQTYGSYTNDNYGAHALQFFLPGITIWFSYRTPVAFMVIGSPRLVRQNEWGPTTGKHLNWIDGGDKASRIDGTEFERLLTEATAFRA
jgi:hypothetical protein